jgi:secreted trypsin-like serine protease
MYNPNIDILGKIDTCQGDSGSPTQYPGTLDGYRGTRIIQYGIVSVGVKGCGTFENYPGIYTNISHYMDFILENISP